MAVQVISRPIGHKLSTTQVEGTIYDNGAGDAVVYVPGGHSLSDGDYVYIESNIEEYNGFKYVDATSYDYFKIKNSENDDFIEFIQESDTIMYISLLEHGWQSVNLPIVYELESGLYPVNQAEESYVPNTIVTYEVSGGNTKINLIAALTDPVALSYIELVGEGPLAGVYKILSVVEDWSVVIDMAYDATYDFSPYIVVKYYNNYFVTVNVYAGLEPDHRWESRKPFELSGSLRFIPDSNGRVKFSIHELLRGYILTRNNLTLGTLPNNLDFHAAFYIKFFESYDTSDGVTVTVENGDETDDSTTFIGYAVNSMMPFKSLNSGFMSDYIGADGYPARWLTLFDVPTAIIGYFFDLSFINIMNGLDVVVNIEKSTGGITTETEVLTITNPGSGIIRVPFTPESGFDKYCLQALIDGEGDFTLSGFSNHDTGGPAWTTGSSPSVVTNAGDPRTDELYVPFSFVDGAEYQFLINFTITSSIGGSLRISGLDSGFNVVNSQTTSLTLVSGTVSATIPLTGNSDMVYLSISATTVTSETIDLVSLSYQVESVAITEQICVNIVEECGTTFTDDNLRLLEDGPFRELE